MRKGRSSDSHRPAGGLPVPSGTVARRFACGIEVHTAAGTVRDSHPIPSYPPPRRDEGYPLRVTKVSIIPRLSKFRSRKFSTFCERLRISYLRPRKPENRNSMTQKITHVCQGTCSRQIDVELENGVVRSVSFTGGCHGNQQGIAALVRGMTAAEAVAGSKASTAGAAARRVPISWQKR